MLPLRAIAALVVVLALAIAACSSASKPAQPETRYYVSLGDSYASGYQPDANGGKGGNTTNGFAYQLVDKLRAAGTDVELVNFGCAGATTASMLQMTGCTALGPASHDYPDQPQATAAEAFLREHRGKVALVTVSIAGNDVTRCGSDPNPVACFTTAVGSIKQNLSTLVAGLRDAAGADVPIIGLTYPDVALAAWLAGGTTAQNLAHLSVTAFQTFLNPALQSTYASVGATFVDITAASGAYGSFDETTSLPPYGTIPTPVAKVCQLTFACDRHDIHPTTAGYTLIADAVLAAFMHR
jgi:lysophospholipase L1-like esterase